MTDHDAEKLQQWRDHGYLEAGSLSTFGQVLEGPDECI